MRGRGGDPVRIGEVLGPALEELGPRGLWTEAELRRAWASIVGDEVAAHARIHRLRGRTLEVAVSSDAWATELTYLAGAILERFGRVLGAGRVLELRVVRARRGRE